MHSTPRRTKIITTLWPASRDEETLQKLLDAGTNLFRFNFSHADHKHTATILKRITNLRNQWYACATILDTKGPEIRSWDLQHPVSYDLAEEFKIVTDKALVDDPKTMYCDYDHFIEDVEPWQVITIDSGLLKTYVTKKTPDHVIVRTKNAASISSRRHINLPWVKLRLPALTEKDKQDLLFWIEQGMDFVAVSFVRTKENIDEVRNFLDTNGWSHMRIIAKIENQEWVENIEEITKRSDAVMIARGDLGVEVNITSLPGIQQSIIDTCIQYGKSVIYATELLKSMVNNIFPTRSEVSDVYHAVANGCDVIMLSDETAVWTYPVESVEMLDGIARQVERDIMQEHKDFTCDITIPYWRDKKYSIMAAHQLADNLGANAILIFTKSWFFARIASAYKTNVPIFSFTPKSTTFQYLHILSGIHPYLLDKESHTRRQDEQYALETLIANGVLKSWDKIIIAYDEDNTEEKVAKVKIQNI